MRPDRMLPLCLAALLQVIPMVRVVLPAAQAVAPSAWIIVLKLAAGTVALLGSYHTVSGATTIVSPHTVNATNGVRYIRQLTVSGRIPGSWSAETAPLNSPIYPLMPGLYLTNVNGKIGGTPTQAGTTNVTITVWEFANNTGGRLSAVFTITVYPSTGPPQIAQQPQSTVVVEGLDAMFSVSARGIEPFAYQWRLNGADLPGRTNSTLILTSVGVGDAGPYSVRVTNSLGATNSQNATLTVRLAPVILSQPSPATQTVNIGDPVTLTVTARGSVPMGFRWQRNGTTVTNIVLNTTNCIFTIPSAQLADAGIYTVVVTNAANSSGILSSNANLTVNTGPANVPPRLDPIPDQLVMLGDMLALMARATDDNTPAQTLSYSLLPGAPSGAAIHPSSGLLAWPTTGAPAPATNAIGVRATDNGSPSLSATQIFRVVVTANHAPVLAAIPDFTADVLDLLLFSNVVADVDRPRDKLTFSLGPGAPAGAQIRPANGLFSWRPSRQQARSTNWITINVTDDGVPPRSDSRTFKVVVNDYAELYSSDREELASDVVDVPLIVRSSTPVSNLTFNVEFSAHFTNATVTPAAGTATLTFVESNRVGLRLTSTSSQPANGETLAYISFTVPADQPSAFVTLKFTQLVVERPGGGTVDHFLTTPGRVVAIGNAPLIQAIRNAPFVYTYGRPGGHNTIDKATSLANGGNWEPIHTYVQSDTLPDVIFLGTHLDARPPTLFLRVRPTEPQTVTISASDPSASEAGPDAGRFTVARSGPTNGPLAVNIAVGGTATNGADYSALGKAVVIEAGQTNVDLLVAPTDDTVPESSETVVVTVAAGPGYQVGSPASATVTIADNDPAPPSLPPSIVKLAFDETSGTNTANSGSAGGMLHLTAPVPMRSTNLPPGVAGLRSLDFGTNVGNFVAESPAVISELGGLTRFTITGWINNRNATEGPGGNRVITWINNGAQGVDVVYKSDGSIQLGINQWPDGTPARSSAGKILTDPAAGLGNWRFFAVTYDSTLGSGQVKFYFGDAATDAVQDVARNYARGAVGTPIGRLAIGQFNSATRPTAQPTRMLRGLVDQVCIFGSALSSNQIVAVQRSVNGASAHLLAASEPGAVGKDGRFRLTVIRPGKGKWVHLSGTGEPHRVYRILASVNLVTWAEIGVVKADGVGHFDYFDTAADDFSTRFYCAAEDAAD